MPHPVLSILLGAVLALGLVKGVGWMRKTPLSVTQAVKGGRAHLRMLLHRVEREDPPEVVHGAMCYRVAAPPDREEYLCPACGERTLYGGETARLLHGGLGPVRRLAEELGNTPFFRANLDETSFCSFCSGPDAPDPPAFLLVLVYQEGDTVRTPVTLTDLQMLTGLVRGELTYTDSYDALLPLRNGLDRLRSLLDLR